MPQTAEGQELPYAGTPEMDALLAQINQNPQMLAVVGQQPALLAEVMKHVGLNTNEQQLIDMVSDWPDEAADTAVQAGQAGVPPTADEEMDQMEEEAGETPEGPPDATIPVEDGEAETQEATPAVPPSGSSSMPRSNNPIDDLISAQMMQSAVGNPNAPVPTGMQVGRQQRPAIPQSRQPSGGNPQQQMIAEIFRKQGGSDKNKKKKVNG